MKTTEEIGPFGPVYRQFVGKPEAAITFLIQQKKGEAVGALHHKDVGDISIVYGNEKLGLAHILDKHPKLLNGIQLLLDQMIISTASENRIVLESVTHRAVVSKMLGQEKTDNWLLSAYERRKTSVSSSDIETEPEGKQNGTAPLQNSTPVVSANKGSK